MAGGEENSLILAVSEFIPLESLKRARSRLEDKDWTLFSYRICLFGLILLATGALLAILITVILYPLTQTSGYINLLGKVLGKLTLCGVLLLAFADFVSDPIEGLTSEVNVTVPNTRLGSYPWRILGLLLSTIMCFLAIRFRLPLTSIEVATSKNMVFNFGQVVGLIILDSVYFGALLSGIGMAWTVMIAPVASEE